MLYPLRTCKLFGHNQNQNKNVRTGKEREREKEDVLKLHLFNRSIQ